MKITTEEDLKNLEILKKWVAWLKYQRVVKNNIDIAQAIKMSRPTISNMFNGNARITDRFILRFEAAYLTSHGYRWSDYEEIKGTPEDVESAKIRGMLEIILAQNSEILALLKK